MPVRDYRADTGLTAEKAREMWSYDPQTGDFTWLVNNHRARSGQKAGTINASGHISIKLAGRRYYAHRLAWLITHGTWPSHVIDHINGDPSDNRLVNLRDVPFCLNAQNIRKPPSNNQTSSFLGVSRYRSGKWKAKINVGGVQIHLGTFSTAEEASEAYLRAKRAHHPGCTI